MPSAGLLVGVGREVLLHILEPTQADFCYRLALCYVDLDAVRQRNVEDLSGGELQRFACAVLCVQQADV